MSFLGYIGKTLGAGTAPIVDANVASQSDIQYREFRDNAPNREELTRISMEEARRAEQLAKDRDREFRDNAPNREELTRIAMEQARRAERIARDREYERQRGQAYFEKQREAGLPTFDIGVIPNIFATAPTTLKPAPAGLPTTTTTTTTTAPAAPSDGQVAFGPTTFPLDKKPGIPTVDKKTAQRLNVLNEQIDRSIARLDEIKAERNKLQRQYKAVDRFASGLGGAETKQKLKVLNQEAATLTAAVKSIQSEVDLFVTGQKTVAAAPPPLAAQVGQYLTDMRPAVTPTYEQFRPAVEAVAPQLGFSLDEANTLMAGLGYGESGFVSGAKSKSGTFTGAYQLGPAIVSQYGPRVQQRFGYIPTSPEGQAAMALMFAADNKKTLVAKGIEPTPPNLALAHNQGAAGAAALLQNPSMLVAEALDKFAPEKNSGSKRASGQAWMKGQDVTKTTAGEFVDRASAYYGKYSPEFSNPKSSPINPDIYLGDPDGLTFDMRQAEFMFNLSRQRQKDILNLIDASDPFSDASQEQLADAYTISERLVQQSGVYTQLQITKGLTSAYGGDTSYLNGVLSGVMDYPIEVTAEAGEQDIAYRITAGGQPVSDSLSYDQMKQFTMRMADSQYDAELTALELAAAAKTNEITMQLGADVYKLRAQGKVDLDLAKYKAGADAILAALNAQFETQGQGMKLTELTETPDGKVLVTDELGRVYEVTTSQQKIGDKMQDITSLELIEVEEQSE